METMLMARVITMMVVATVGLCTLLIVAIRELIKNL